MFIKGGFLDILWITWMISCHCVLPALSTEAHPHWTYEKEGPSNWYVSYPYCNKTSQSPIDIRVKNTVVDNLLASISLVNSGATSAVVISNNGHTASFSYVSSVPIRLSGGKFRASYRLAGVHFHWGVDTSTGSEHQLDGKPYAMEMHVVSHDEKYPDATKATEARDVNAIAVLGVLFSISDKDNSQFQPIISQLKDIVEQNSNKTIGFVDLKSLLPSDLSSYYRYNGSLTTPPCAENVLWTVFTTTQTISAAQISEFRKLKISESGEESEFLTYNWRPIQPVGDRIVYRSTSMGSEGLRLPVVKFHLLVAALCSFVAKMLK